MTTINDLNTKEEAQNSESFKTRILSHLLAFLKSRSDVHAVWEAGSAATGTMDEYSDVDLVILSDGKASEIFDKVEESINAVSEITHKYDEPPSICAAFTHKIYFLKGAPKHFYLDIGVLSSESNSTIKELLQVEKHGTPVVHFDKSGVVKATAADLSELKEEHHRRISDSKAAFPVVFTTVMKELDRGHPIDAFVFYFGLVKRYVELLGIRYRPYRYDFGLRYTSRDFPSEVYERLNKYLYVSDASELKSLALELKEEFYENLKFIENSFEAS